VAEATTQVACPELAGHIRQLIFPAEMLLGRLFAHCALLAAASPARSFSTGSALEAASGRMVLSLDPETGQYSLRVESHIVTARQTWLVSAPTMLHTSGRWLKLSMQNASTSEGSDATLGSYTRLSAQMEGTSASGGTVRMETAFRAYHRPLDAAGVVVAEQRFPDGMEGVSLPVPAAHDQAASHCPSWRIGGDSEGLLGHNLQFMAGCDGQPARSPVGTVFPTGYESSFIGKGLPLALLHTGQNGTSDVLVMSPVHAFVSSTIAVANLSDGSQSLAAGVVGSVTSIPSGYTMHTALTMPAAGSGFTEAMMHWGDTMLALGGGKARAKHNAAPMASHLGYSTTAFYFCEFVAVQFVQHSLPLLTPPPMVVFSADR